MVPFVLGGGEGGGVGVGGEHHRVQDSVFRI